MINNPKTTCTLLTPSGRGAVAVIAIRGLVKDVLSSNFKPINGKSLAAQRNRKIVYGIWNSTGEDLIVYRRSEGNPTKTPLETFEIHCHGGSMASKAIIEDLKSAGIEQTAPHDFLKNTTNVWEADVRIALSQATTNRTAEILLRQLSIGPARARAIATEVRASRFESALKQIESIRSWAEFGIQLNRPRKVVFCGQPNVGKSSLVNAIVGFQRAIVNEVAGTTRDVVSQSTAISGWPVELRDTAGLRDSDDVIESIGIEKAQSEIANADLKICVFDVSKQWGPLDQKLVDSIAPSLIVLNKSDLVAESEVQNRLARLANSVATSVQSGETIETLIQKIGTLLTPSLPQPNQAIPVSVEQAARLDESAAMLENVLTQENLTDSEMESNVALALDRLEKG